MRTKFMKGLDGKFNHETDDDWPSVLVSFSDSKRVIYTAEGDQLILQIRHRNPRNDKWRKWVFVAMKKSHEEMRKLMELSHPFSWDSENLDAICLKTDDGEFVDHSH